MRTGHDQLAGVDFWELYFSVYYGCFVRFSFHSLSVHHLHDYHVLPTLFTKNALGFEICNDLVHSFLTLGTQCLGFVSTGDLTQLKSVTNNTSLISFLSFAPSPSSQIQTGTAILQSNTARSSKGLDQ